ncbi:DUF1538 family protein [Bacillus sp. m3-13]|uniref:DUF1538 family protein n=1 Tax=Bacillus sp. m3-13 TaxID=406124 RepID=UPI0004946D94|nr:DUF1538 family protein [Bacillus sp. m3-13]
MGVRKWRILKIQSKNLFLAILPVSAVIILLQIFLIGLPLEKFLLFLIGLLMVTFGLMFFLMGVNIGLLPVGDMIGKALPKTKEEVVNHRCRAIVGYRRHCGRTGCKGVGNASG